MKNKFKEYNGFNLSDVNKEVLEKWDAEQVFAESMKIREGHPSFVFYEGPPSANGMPGIHHVMARTIKDLFCRYKTMKGFHVKRKAGWDTHGLPVELGVEKSLGITKEDIGKKISVDDYNMACRREVMKYTKEWEDLTHKMGYWVDTKDPYITYDNRYMESVWWLLQQLYKKGYLYKGYTIQPYSPAAGTGLSSHELNQPGCYRDVKDTTCVAQFRIKNPRPEMAEWGTPYFLAWTTTPWTLPSNTALCVGPKIDYLAVQSYNGYNGEKITAIVAKPLLYHHFNQKAEGLALEDYKPGDKLVPFKVVAEYKGPDLVGMQYEQLFPWVKPVEMDADGNFKNAADKAFRVIAGDYVTTDDGTGIVHIAPTFGADDAFVARAAGIPSLFMINKKGETRPMVDLTGKFYMLDELDERFVAECVDVNVYKNYQGAWVKNAYDPQFNVDGKYDDKAAAAAESLDIRLCMEMKQENKVFKIEKHVHNYPHCWRTDKPVLYYPLDSWFIRTTASRDRLIELNNTINWKPQSTGSGRFGKWLENLNDWNLSRSRYWGTPLPIWRTEDGDEEKCIGSVEELYNEIEKAVAAGVMKSNPYKDKGFVPGVYTAENYDKIDLHRPYVDDIKLVSDSGKPMRRELDLIDVWFDSGSMPYAQIHYPFENKEAFDKREVYPADFIAEGVDQTRGWFFTLHAIAGMVFDTKAYKSVISNGLVLDKNGNKMSKRLGNAVDPFEALEQYGADAIRWYFYINSAPWLPNRFHGKAVQEGQRKFMSTLWNTYAFYVLYAEIDQFDATKYTLEYDKLSVMDKWLLSKLNTLVKTVDDNLGNYRIPEAARALDTFVDEMSNWYVRRSRDRFWAKGMEQDKINAYMTLYTALVTVAKTAAPMIPFMTEDIYQNLVRNLDKNAPESIHLCDYPVADEKFIDKELEANMDAVLKVVVIGRACRNTANIKTKQPIGNMYIKADFTLSEYFDEIIEDELNVKKVTFAEDVSEFTGYTFKPQLRTVGPKYGKYLKQIQETLASLDGNAAMQELKEKGSIVLDNISDEVVLCEEDLLISMSQKEGYIADSDNGITVVLDTNLTPELIEEGMVREIISKLQTMRKEADFEVTDRIIVTFEASDNVNNIFQKYGENIKQVVLADELINGNISGYQKDWKINGEAVSLGVQKK